MCSTTHNILNYTLTILLKATELLEFGGISEDSPYEGNLENGSDEDILENGSTGTEANEFRKTEEDLSFTPAGSQFGEIGERIRSAKATSRLKQKQANLTTVPLNNHILTYD